jgi:hypothetical protein
LSRLLSLQRTVIRICTSPGACRFVNAVALKSVRAAMSYDTWGLLGQMLRRKYDLRFQRDLVTYMFTVAKFACIPLFLSHTVPPNYIAILWKTEDACQ